MGEYADMLISGLLDEETGELIDGDAPGYPRRKRKAKRKPSKAVAGGLSAIGKVQCPDCGKRVKASGLRDHRRDAHNAIV